MDGQQLDWIDSAPTRPGLAYPASPGHRGVDTSRAAANAIALRLGSVQSMVLAVIDAAGAQGATSDEIAANLGWERHSVRPRTAELRKAGSIRDSCQRRTNASGRAAIVWTVN